MGEKIGCVANWKHPTGQKIDTLYAWVATEPDGGEGICSMTLPDGLMMPLIGADKARIESLRQFAEVTHAATGYPVCLKMFSGGVVLDFSRMNLRPRFYAITAGWMLIDDFDDLTDRIERLAAWKKTNGPLTEDEQATVTFMIECQIVRGMR